MFWKKENVEQKQIVVDLQILDDVFHRTIIALERLESFLQKGKNEYLSPLKQTAIGSSRDLHNDEKNYRDKDSYFDELALDCMALFKAAKIDDESIFVPSVEYFLQDIIEWYAGRDGVEYNEVDSCIIPIIIAISRQVRSTRELDEVYEKYVYKADDQQQTIENKFNSVQEGMTAWMLASDETMQPIYNSHHNDTVEFTKHKRGDVLTGYKRIISYLTTRENALPVKIFLRTIKKYLPNLAKQLPQVTEENIDKLYSEKLENTSEGSAHIPLNTKNETEEILESIEVNGAKYYRFYCPDIVSEGNETPHFWTHHNCDGDIYIGDNAHFLCIKDNSTWPVIFSSLVTPSTSNSDEYSVSQSPYIIEQHTKFIADIAAFMALYAGLNWMREFLYNADMLLSKKETVDALMPILKNAVKTILDRENITYTTIEITIK